jgi:Protease II
VSWAADNKTVFYSRTDSAHRPDKIFRHTVGTGPAADVMVYHEPDLLFSVSVGRTKDDKYQVIESGSFTSTEQWYVPSATPTAAWKVFERRRPDVVYGLEHHGREFFFLTNDSATNFRGMVAPDGTPGRKYWRPLIAERRSVLISGMDVFRNYLVLSERGDGKTSVRVRDLRNGAEHTSRSTSRCTRCSPVQHRSTIRTRCVSRSSRS